MLRVSARGCPAYTGRWYRKILSCSHFNQRKVHHIITSHAENRSRS